MEGIVDFCYRDKGIDTLISTKHRHNLSYEILHIISGKGSFLLNDKLYPLKNDSIFFISSNNIHCSLPEAPQKYIRNKIVFSSSFITKIAEATECEDIPNRLFSDNGYYLSLEKNQSSFIDGIFKDIQDSINKNDKLELAFHIFKILKLACKNSGRSITPAENTVSKILEYINQNISSKLTLNILCESFHISKCYLCHIFKASTGLTVYEYILSIRLAKARQMLEDTDKSISEIALQCGFSDFSYFSKAFRASEGITPRQYRHIPRITS